MFSTTYKFLSLSTCISPWSLGFVLWFYFYSYCCLHLLFGISLIWVFLSLFFLLCSFAWKIQDSYLLAWGLLDCGLPPCAQIGRSQTLVGSSNHNPFAAILSHAWQAWSISSDQRFSIQKDWTRKRSPLASRISSRETGCQVTVWLLPGNAVLCWLASTAVASRMAFFTLQKTGWPMDGGCRENQRSRAFSSPLSPVTKGHLPPTP